jgi:1-acyl-sn-glycerol-3-phosphate acyltransferase
MTPGYKFVITLARPLMRPWSRLTVRGLEHLPVSGPALLVGNHDSYWDPIAVAVAAGPVRQVHALAKSTLWKNKFVGALMTEMGHIPVERAASNAAAMRAAVRALHDGKCIGVFPEGTRSLGRELRARSGVGRLSQAVPEATIVCVRVTGSVDVVRVPKRPRIDVEFYRPAGALQPGESAIRFAQRLLDELREGAPRQIPGRRRTAAKYRQRLAAQSPT